MSTGQGVGAGLGAIVGAIILAPLTAGASVGALASLTAGQIVAGVALGATLGQTIGGLIDPPRALSPRNQHEVLQVGYNTFASDLPIPLVFNRGIISGNIMFQGATFGRVETVGQQTVGSGKQEQTVDVQQVVYYADFVVGLCEGPIRRVVRVWKDDVEISDQHGLLFTIYNGTADEQVMALVAGAPNVPTDPVPWRRTAKIAWSGKLGEVNQLPRLSVELWGPDPVRENSGACVDGMPRNLSGVSYDETSDRVVGVDYDRRIVLFARDGSDVDEAWAPTHRGAAVERAFYDGREDVVIAFYAVTSSLRSWAVGEPGFAADSAWEIYESTHAAMTADLRSFAYDPEHRGVLLLSRAGDGDIWLTRLSTRDGSFDAMRIAASDGETWDVRGCTFDPGSRTFYLLYLEAGELRLRRGRLLGASLDLADVDEMVVRYSWRDPIGVAKSGDIFTVFDASDDTPLHQFEWGAATDRYVRGVRAESSAFSLLGVEGLSLWLEAEYLRQSYSADQAVASWPDRSPFALQAMQFDADKRPILKNGVINGYAALRFDGVNDLLEVQGPTVDHRAFTMFIVARPSSISATLRALFTTDDATPGDETHWLAFGGAPGLVAWTGENSAALVTATQAANEWAVWSIVGSPAGLSRWKNGAFQGSAPHAAGGGFHYVTRIGGQFAATGPAPFQGDVAEIATFDRALTDAEREQVEWAFRRKYLLSWSTAPEYRYVLEAQKLNFRAPTEFWFAPSLFALMVLESFEGTWRLLMFQWDGSNWSTVAHGDYTRVRFDEPSSAAGVLAMLALRSADDLPQLLNIPARSVSLAALDRLSGWCNRPVDFRLYAVDPAQYAPALQIDYEVLTLRQSVEIFRELLAAVHGFVFQVGDEVHFALDGVPAPVEMHFDEDGIVGEPRRAEVAAENRFNDARVRFRDADNEWKTAIAPFAADWEIHHGMSLRPKQFDAIACIRARQAAFLAQSFVLVSVFRRDVADIEVKAEAKRLVPLSVVTVSCARFGWVRRRFRVAALVLTPRHTVQLSLIEDVATLVEWPSYPLQRPDAAVLRLLNAVVTGAARVAVIEDDQTASLWLFASLPDGAGAWSYLRWMVRWVQSATPAATAYPGPVAFSPTVPYLYASTTHTSPSGLLCLAVTGAQSSMFIGAVVGQLPDAGAVAILADPEMPASQFANTHGNGRYERMTLTGSSTAIPAQTFFGGATKQINLTRNGIGLGPHTPVAVGIMGIYVRVDDSAGAVSTPQLLFGNPGGWQSSAPDPWADPAGQMFVLFKPADFVAGVKAGLNALLCRVAESDDLNQDGANLGLVLHYSVGGGEFKPLERVVDDTLGLRRSGLLSWDMPDDWAPSAQWKPGTDFAGLGSLLGGVPYVLRISVGNPLGTSVPRTARLGYTPTAPVVGGGGSFSISAGMAPPGNPVGMRLPVVHFVVPNATPTYPFVPAEVGFRTAWTPQPVGPRGEAGELALLPSRQVTLASYVTG